MHSKNRQFMRTPVEVEVHVSTIDPEIDQDTGRRYFRDSEETCATLSPGGAFIRSIDPPTPGRRVLVQIHVPGDEKPIEATGRVAWSKHLLDPAAPEQDLSPSGAGVVFDADPEAEAALQRFLLNASKNRAARE